MSRLKCVLLCAFLALSALGPADARKSFGGRSHYPRSGGLSGSSHGGSHSYPKSPGLSGGGHGYPSSGGMSGGAHGYPSSGNSHGYPASGGLSGSGSRPAYPSNTNTHPSSNHGYPASGGLSGNSNNNANRGGHTTINNHYHYSPPQQIRYQPAYGAAPVSYPVYRGTPPTYVYQYQNSGSKYSTLLAGLALFNLGALGGAAYGLHHSSSNSGSGGGYRAQPGEVCRFGLKKENGDYEETRIDCNLISSFIYEAEAKKNNSPTNTSVVTTTVTNVTVVNTTNGEPAPVPVADATPNFTVLENGTLVPGNMTSNGTAANVTANESDSTHKTDDSVNTMTSSVITSTTTTNTTVVNAVDVKGPPVDVTPGMTCYVIRTTPSSRMKKAVPCGLLQTYSQQSLKRSAANRNAPLFTLLSVAIVAFAMY
ncbi:protein lingerer [Plutella xylostella]|uniref:protein lingerer n=1 Tax=Plutella xylostella TaxID=51655 RepID=UPI0020321C3A|nr:protein lingerer [Plutella xylostella]